MLGQDSWDRTSKAGQPGQDSQERTARTGLLKNVGTVQAGPEREDRMART